MKTFAAFGVAMIVLALAISPVAQAEPTADDYYSKRLSGYGVNYQHTMTFDEMVALAHTLCDLIGGYPAPETVVGARQRVLATGVLEADDGRQVVIAATESYCDQYTDLVQATLFPPQ